MCRALCILPLGSSDPCPALLAAGGRVQQWFLRRRRRLQPQETLMVLLAGGLGGDAHPEPPGRWSCLLWDPVGMVYSGVSSRARDPP